MLVYLGAMFVLIIILIAVYMILNKFIKGGVNTPQIRFIKKYYIDRNFYVGLLKIFDEYYLILFSSTSAEVLKKLTYEEMTSLIGEKQAFISTFSQLIKREKDEND